MPSKKNLSLEEQAAFQEAMQDVIPLGEKKLPALSSVHKKLSPQNQKTRQKQPPCELPDWQDHLVPWVPGEEIIRYAVPGLQARVLRLFYQGKYPIEATLDLHGYTLLQAKKKLVQFLTYTEHQHCRCLLIIHGKGRRSKEPYPPLKNALNNWLRQYPGVLALSSAKPNAGGLGALYVLLKGR